MTPEYQAYQQQVAKNAVALAEALQEEGLTMTMQKFLQKLRLQLLQKLPNILCSLTNGSLANN